MPDIQQELIQAILELLAEEDPYSLPCCALVNRSWVQPAQSCIFNTISLGVGVQKGFALGLMEVPPLGEATNLYPHFRDLNTISLGVGVQKGFALGLMEVPPLGEATNLYPHFRDLLAESPHLARHVRTLNLGFQPLPSERDMSDSLSSDDWEEIEESILGFLPSLLGLKSMGLFPCGSGTHTFYLQPRIAGITRTLSLQSLSFSCGSGTHTFYLQPRIAGITRTLSLQSLSFCNCVLTDSSALAPFGRALKSLNFFGCEFKPPSFRAAHATLGVSIHFSFFRAADPPKQVVPNSPPIFSLAAFAHLETLHLVFNDDYAASGPIPMPWVETVLDAVVIPERLRLHLTATTKYPRQPSWEGLHLRSTSHPNRTQKVAL
ncbi:hypothetical protein DFH06DRAFT_1145397 [Mycena polygramma]|nr:hypothetical protein DFH06DRAFT_1145397 [Mycena polygramma]